MSATKQTTQMPTVLAERTQDGVTMYMPNMGLFNPFYIRTSAGTFTSSSHAALAFDLLQCKRSLESTEDMSSLRDLELHHKLGWLLAQPLFIPLLEGSFEDLCKTLRNDPSILQTAFPRTRGPQGTLKLKLERIQNLSSESSEASEEKSEPSPLEAPSDLAPAGALAPPALPSAQGLVSPEEIIDLASPVDEDIQPLHQDFRSPPLSNGNKVVRTNWANFPLKTGSQSVLLTKFQVASGAVSVPLGRAHSVLGAFSKSCTVTLQSASSSSSAASGPSQRTWQCGYKLYQSQPTQVFLTKLKAFFTTFTAKAGDVLSLSEVSPGICNAVIWHATSPQAIEFKSLLANGWSDVSPPLKNPVSPLEECTLDTAQEKKRQQRAKDGEKTNEVIDLVIGEIEEDRRGENPVVEQTTARRTRQAPRRLIVYSSSESQGEEDLEGEERYDEEYSIKNKRKRHGRSKTPAEKQQQQQQPPRSVFIYDAENTMNQGNDKSSIYSRLKSQRQIPITNYTTVNPPLAAPSGHAPYRRHPAGDRLRRSPAKKPRKAYQPTPIDLTTVEGPESVIMGGTASASVLNETGATRRNRRRAPSRSISPLEATTKQRYCSTYRTSGEGSSGRSGGPGSGRVRKPGGGYFFRSETAHLKLRKVRRKGIPQRAPDGEPNMQAYYSALVFVDSLRVINRIAA
ncbi:hypothetical protein Ndes2437A_g07723 [Nannochloris sp. 'desiccata']